MERYWHLSFIENQMKLSHFWQKLSELFLWTATFLGAAILVGRNHFILGSLLALLQFPLILCGILLYLKRRRSGLKIVHILFIMMTGALLLHTLYDRSWRLRWVALEGEGQEISILSSNLFFKNNYKQNILDEIRANPTDLLFVQELTPAWKAKLGPLLAQRYKYRRDMASRYTYGTGIYSKYPIVSNKLLRNTARQPFCQIVEINIGGKKVVCINVHLASPAIAVENPQRFFPLYEQNSKDRSLQLKELETYLEKHHSGQSIIMVGDLNTPRLEPLYRNIRHRWADLHKKTGRGMGWTFPNIAKLPFPILTLDYILYRGRVKGKQFSVLPGSSSDHLAIKGLLEV